MANNSHNSDANKKNRSLREFLDENNGRPPAARAQSVPKEDPWSDDFPAKKAELKATSDQEHDEIVRRLRNQQLDQRPGGFAPSEPVEEPPEEPKAQRGVTEEEADKLLEENQELRNIIAELKQCLEESTAAKKPDETWEDREREYEAILEEKSEKIRELYVRIQDLEKQGGGGGGSGSGGAPAPTDEHSPNNDELLALSDELERERCQIEQERRQLEEDRRQLREDEDAMMRQMREMELQMAKERAELARQRNELQRLHSEIRHELELAQRDAAVNERLRMLQRRNNELGSEATEQPAARKKSGQTPIKEDPKKETGSMGIMKRFFGGSDKK